MIAFRIWDFKLPVLSLLTSIFGVVLSDHTLAQNRITPDSSLGTEQSRLIRQTGQPNVDRIQGGARRGNLLFHSFDEFNVEQSAEATFANPRGISNIFTRVTGPLKSNILGTLGVDGNANLYFLNPNGIYFGPQSRLNIAGSFFASTASALDLGDGAMFQADTSEVPNLLMLRVPIGAQLGGQPGDIVTDGQLQAGQDLSLVGNRLMISGEVLAERDVLLKGNEVSILESDRPFWAEAGRNLEIEGIDAIDLNTLGFEESKLLSGGNLVLRSLNPIQSKARFLAGRDFTVEAFDEKFGQLVSPNGQVIFAEGNVALGKFMGGSLHILAGGSIQLGSVQIEESGSVEATINPNHNHQVNGRLTYADLASFEVSDFELKKNGAGRLQQVPKRHAIAIDGNQQATLDLRAGVDWNALGGISQQSKVSGNTSLPDHRNRASRIIVDGNARIDQPEGQILLTNRFRPNREVQEGSIISRVLDTSAYANELAGNISILGQGDITSSLINTTSTVTLDEDNNVAVDKTSGNGGDILISSISGKITNSSVLSYSKGNLGNGGHIVMSSVSGPIDNLDINSGGITKYGNSGRGGDIKISSISGDISVLGKNKKEKLQSIAFSRDGNSNRGGNIFVYSISGNITLKKETVSASTAFKQGTSGRGGNINIYSRSGHISSQSFIRSQSSGFSRSGQGGDITISSNSGRIQNEIIESRSFSSMGNSDRGGNVKISSVSGDITNQEIISASASRSGNSGKGGDIEIYTVSGQIDNNELSASSTAKQNSGPGGDIIVQSKSGRINNTTLLSRTFSSGKGNSSRGGDITVSSTDGNINNGDLRSASSARNGQSGQGGNIEIFSETGNINSQILRTSSVAQAGKNSGRGGNIKVSSISGNITIGDSIATFSVSRDDKAGDAGTVSINAPKGGLIGYVPNLEKTQEEMTQPTRPQILAFSIGERGSAQGGDVSITANSVKNLSISTLSSNNKSGNVSIKSINKPLLVNDLNILANAREDLQIISSIDDFSEFTIPRSVIGNSGNIFISSASEAQLDNVMIESNSFGRESAGLIKVESSENLFIKNSSLTTDADGDGQAGNIDLNAYTILLNKAEIASRVDGEAEPGNLNIDFGNLLLLTNQSKVTAEAKSNAEGGNISINSRIGSIVGLPSPEDGNDIVANAIQGPGGNITINAESISGFIESQPQTGNKTNDINASSETNLEGTVSISAVEVDPNENQPPLPNSFNPSLIQNFCQPERQSSLINSGKGGMEMITPIDAQLNQTWEDFRLAADVIDSASAPRTRVPNRLDKMTQNNTTKIVEAQSIVRSPTGQLMIVATSSEKLSQGQLPYQDCQNRQP